VKILKNHFGDKLHWYGNGVNEIEKKSDIIFKSRYHIAIENDSRNNLVSEKLYDSFLGLAFPIYYGAPNVNELFDKDSLISIDINNINSSINSIEKAIESNLYQKNFNQLLKSKNQVLNQFNIFNRLNRLVKDSTAEKPLQSEIVSIHSF
jgi:predicted glycosyltransferase